jgi:hypothetical protein
MLAHPPVWLLEKMNGLGPTAAGYLHPGQCPDCASMERNWLHANHVHVAHELIYMWSRHAANVMAHLTALLPSQWFVRFPTSKWQDLRKQYTRSTCHCQSS